MRVGVIAATTRPGRKCIGVARWVAGGIGERSGLEPDVADLGEVALPMFDEPEHPRLRRYRHDHTRSWSARVETWSALVVVTPEYNHSYPGSIKNALDYLYEEWHGLPVGFVSYGGKSAGIRAPQHLLPVALELGMRPLHADVAIAFHRDHLDEDGSFRPTAGHEAQLCTLLEELHERIRP